MCSRINQGGAEPSLYKGHVDGDGEMQLLRNLVFISLRKINHSRRNWVYIDISAHAMLSKSGTRAARSSIRLAVVVSKIVDKRLKCWMKYDEC